MSRSSNPPLSILMPVRNEERYLQAALDSLFRQTFQDWELIAVDDGSTDATIQILRRAVAGNARVKVYSTGGAGLVAALNLGLSLCRSPLVARMDGDDVCHPRRLERQVAFMKEHPEVGLVASRFRHFPRHMVKGGMLGYELWQNGLDSHETTVADLFVESPFVHPSVMYRRELVLALGGYREMGWPEDYDLWLRMSTAGISFHRLSETLFFWRERKERATRTLPAYGPEAFRACKLHHLQQSLLKGITEVTMAGAGVEGRKWRSLLNGAGIGVKLWIDVDPRKIGSRLHGAPVVAPSDVSPDGGKMLIAIGTADGRDGARAWALEKGFVQGEDFVCVS